ncbi:hypothetical protein HERIO_741 [Hepatospora eriocheir]|uniref:Uncharacterized protein n=1 Tax=Hepatospora eriocheir TaxID=1081669 RepID=A0A1X0QC42_9MICR|nr:hypothetical protein HERIO_741 [Hepatospora eriocheir]
MEKKGEMTSDYKFNSLSIKLDDNEQIKTKVDLSSEKYQITDPFNHKIKEKSNDVEKDLKELEKELEVEVLSDLSEEIIVKSDVFDDEQISTIIIPTNPYDKVGYSIERDNDLIIDKVNKNLKINLISDKSIDESLSKISIRKTNNHIVSMKLYDEKLFKQQKNTNKHNELIKIDKRCFPDIQLLNSVILRDGLLYYFKIIQLNTFWLIHRFVFNVGDEYEIIEDFFKINKNKEFFGKFISKNVTNITFRRSHYLFYESSESNFIKVTMRLVGSSLLVTDLNNKVINFISNDKRFIIKESKKSFYIRNSIEIYKFTCSCEIERDEWVSTILKN